MKAVVLAGLMALALSACHKEEKPVVVEPVVVAPSTPAPVVVAPAASAPDTTVVAVPEEKK